VDEESFEFIIFDENEQEVNKKIAWASKTNDYTMKVPFTGLISGKRYTARVGNRSCKFITASAGDETFSFVFSSCLGGQGYGRTKSGWKIFEQIGKLSPNFYICTGDTIYADAKIPKIVKLPDGSKRENIPHDVICRNLDQFRERYRYHLEDPFYSKFLSQTPTYVTWDDHDIVDNWGSEHLKANDPELLQNGVQAFFEY